jgi:hypothetical protein
MNSFDRRITQFFHKYFTPRVVFPFMFLILISIMMSHAILLKKTVYGDGIFYFSWLRSVVVEKNIDFTGEYAHFSVTQPLTIHRSLSNKYSIGPAIAWSYSYIPLYSILRGSGFEFPYELMCGVSSVLFGFAGLILIFRMLTSFVGERSALAAVTALLGATPFLFYGSIDPVNSHIIALFSCTVFLSYALSEKGKPFIVGLLLGLAGLVRPMDMIIGLSVFPTYKDKLPLVLFGILVGFFPQMIFWGKQEIFSSVLMRSMVKAFHFPLLISQKLFSHLPSEFSLLHLSFSCHSSDFFFRGKYIP